MTWPPGRRYNAAMNPSRALLPVPESVPRTVPVTDPVDASAASDEADPLPPGLPDGLTVEDAQRIAAALSAAHADSTRATYAHMWRVWERWCTHRGGRAGASESRTGCP